MVTRIQKEDNGKTVVAINWGVFLTAIAMLFSASMYIVLQMSSVERSIAVLQQTYAQEVIKHGTDIRELQHEVKVLDNKVQHVDQELDWHIESKKK